MIVKSISKRLKIRKELIRIIYISKGSTINDFQILKKLPESPNTYLDIEKDKDLIIELNKVKDLFLSSLIDEDIILPAKSVIDQLFY